MKPLNTFPIEEFLDKTRIAIKTGQKSVTLTIKEATDLQNSLSVVMTRLTGEIDHVLNNVQQESTVEVKMDGGKF